MAHIPYWQHLQMKYARKAHRDRSGIRIPPRQLEQQQYETWEDYPEDEWLDDQWE